MGARRVAGPRAASAAARRGAAESAGQAGSWRELFSNKSYRFLYGAQVAIVVGDSFGSLALALHVFAVTGSAFSLAMGYTLMAVPWVAVGPLAGSLADRVDRRFIVAGSLLCAAGVMISLAFLGDLTSIFIACFVSGCATVAASLAMAALVPRIIDRRLFSRATSLGLITRQAVRLCGPVLAGVAVACISARGAFLVNAAALVAGAALAMLVRGPGAEAAEAPEAARAHAAGAGGQAGPAKQAGPGAMLADAGRGFRWAWRSVPVRLLTVLFLFAVLAETLPGLNTIVYLDRVLGAGPSAAGTLMGIIAGGSILGAYLVPILEGRLGRHVVLLSGAVFLAVALLPAAWAQPLAVIGALWFVHGFGIGMLDAASGTYMMELVPDEWRGRVYAAVNAACSGLGLAWNLAVGRITEAAGVNHAFLWGGVLSALGVAVVGAWGLLPALARAGAAPQGHKVSRRPGT